MIKNSILAMATAALLALSATSIANETAQQPKAQASATQPNIFDPNFWFSGFGAAPATSATELSFNAAHPSAWMKFVDPETHVMTHMQFTNPATYAQFMQPQFFLEFMKPENMSAWMDFNQYAVIMNPQTMAYWMNPANYMHAFDPKMYAVPMDPNNYMVYMNPATYMGWAGIPDSTKPAEITQ